MQILTLAFVLGNVPSAPCFLPTTDLPNVYLSVLLHFTLTKQVEPVCLDAPT